MLSIGENSRDGESNLTFQCIYTNFGPLFIVYIITNNPHLAIENATGYQLQEHTINIYALTSAQSD